MLIVLRGKGDHCIISKGNYYYAHPFNGFIICLYTVTSSCIPLSRHGRVLSLTSRPVSLLATTKASAFFFIVRTLQPNILTPSALTKRWCVQFNFKPSRFAWTLLMAYSKAKLKSNGDKASPCGKPFLIRKSQTNICLPGLYYVFHAGTFLLALSVSWGYQNQWKHYTRTRPSS